MTKCQRQKSVKEEAGMKKDSLGKEDMVKNRTM